MFKHFFGLRLRIILLIVVALTVAAVPVYFLLRHELAGVLKARLNASYVAVGKDLANRSVDLIMTDALFQLYTLIKDVKNADEEIAYIYIVDTKNELIVHTFKETAPPGLLQANILGAGQTYSGRAVRYQDETVEDIALPVFDKALGTLHLGVSLIRMKMILLRATFEIVLYISVVLLVIAAFIVLLISRFLRPIEKIVAAMEKIGEGDLNRKIGLHTGDEIEMIANAVDQMTMRLKDVTVARDVLAAEIEERRKVERRLMEVSDQLIQSEKMASVGQLAAGVAHEINNPIGFVSSNLEALKVYFDRLGRIMDHYARIEAYLRTLSADEAVRLCGSLDKLKEECDLNYVLEDIPKIFEDCSAGVQRVAATVRDLRVFSHKGSLEKQYEDVNSLLETALRVLGGAMRHKVVLKKNLAADLPRVRCHPQHLSQVFVNLILNAIQSIEDQGQISIRTFSTEGKVFVEIADTGAGMEEGVLHKIFDPFFTTKEVGVGTGLGLSISYGIIQNHGGEIRVSSKVKAGSTFTVILPAEGFEFPV